MGLQYLQYNQIDKSKWDNIIKNASNGLIYGYSFYLDCLSKHWDAIVLNDYEAVMPLTWNKKYGIYYLYLPPFTACLGIFGNNLNSDIQEEFLQAIPLKFRYWDIIFNHGNYYKSANYKLYQRVNYVLPLKLGYQYLTSQYSDNIKRNVNKSQQYELVIKKNIDIDELLVLAKEQTKIFTKLSTIDFDHFRKLYNILIDNEMAVNYGVFMPTGTLISGAVFFFSHGRAYYILVGNHQEGRSRGSSHALIDAFIKDNAGQDILLDFEGSDIPSLAFFYSGFGAKEEFRLAIRLNRLPTILKWFKKD